MVILPPSTMVVFILAAVLWFGMLLIHGVKKNIILLAFIAGLAYVLTFIDGVAPISKYVSTKGIDPFWNGVYAISQQVSWWGAAAWAIFIFALLTKEIVDYSDGNVCRSYVHDSRLSHGD